MANLIHYGPYAWVSASGMPPGDAHYWSFGPWPWYASVVSITAHPLALAGADRVLEVSSITAHVTPIGDRFIHCTVRNVGTDRVNYAVWLGGVSS